MDGDVTPAVIGAAVLVWVALLLSGLPTPTALPCDGQEVFLGVGPVALASVHLLAAAAGRRGAVRLTTSTPPALGDAATAMVTAPRRP